jgi:predicted PurR-regulated permease PerM
MISATRNFAILTNHQKYFRTPEAQEKTTDPFVSFYSSSRIDKLVNILITFVIFCLLVIPVVTMYQLTNTAAHVVTDAQGNMTTTSQADIDSRDTFNAVGVLIVFTLLFSAAMSLLTKAARHELFAASAAYCAILVVFIGNFTGPGN